MSKVFSMVDIEEQNSKKRIDFAITIRKLKELDPFEAALVLITASIVIDSLIKNRLVEKHD